MNPGIAAESMDRLVSLKSLALDNNLLTALPSCICSQQTKSPTQVELAGMRLTSLQLPWVELQSRLQANPERDREREREREREKERERERSIDRERQVGPP